jgi:hypothetical protein
MKNKIDALLAGGVGDAALSDAAIQNKKRAESGWIHLCIHFDMQLCFKTERKALECL